MTSTNKKPELTCPLCGKPSVDGKEHQECMDREAAGTGELDKIEAEQREGLNEGAETPPGEDEIPGEQPPIYLQDEPPDGKVNIIKWALMHGITEEELKADPQHNTRTVDICAQELEKDGYRKRPPRPPKDEKKTSVATTPPGKGVQTYAKGSPPEAIIESMDLPIVDGQIVGFESGMKFGARMVVMGVRIAQELSALGIQQVKPLIELSRDARMGEEGAAKSAATEAAMSAASMVQQNLVPYLANIGKPAEANPMQGMMVRTMEPIIQRLMGGLIPGGGPQQAQGWTKRQE